MKRWGDHYSSDEESFNEDTPLETFDSDDEAPKKASEPAEVTLTAEQLQDSHNKGEGEPPSPARTYNFPSQPPFTIFVGNLSYDIKDGPMLGDSLAKVVRDRLQKDITIVHAKIPSLNQGGRDGAAHKGFGYVEVASVEEMKIVLDLNMDPGARMANRKMQLDTAQPMKNKQSNNNSNNNSNNFNPRNSGARRTSAPPEVDGRQFRQGKFANPNNHSNNNNTNIPGGPSKPPTTQRPSLILKPRTKPIEEKEAPQQDPGIFGGAKPRDANAWQPNKRASAPPSTAAPAAATANANAPPPASSTEEGTDHQQQQQQAPAKQNNSNNPHPNSQEPRRPSGRGGRGGRSDFGRGGRGEGRGRGSHHAADGEDHVTHHKDSTRRGSHSNNKHEKGGGRGGGRGGSGRGGAGGGGGRHIANHDNAKGRGGGAGQKKDNHDKKKDKPADAAAAALPPAAAAVPAAAVVTTETKPEPKRVSNTFAALAFDSDSD